jgi:FtsP/CotA-like multicopper oxidase with cupredoxin domain
LYWISEIFSSLNSQTTESTSMLLANLTNAFIFIPFVAALVLGFTIHFFIKSRRALKEIENSGKKRAMVSSAVDDDIPEALKPKPAEPQIIEDDVTPLVQTAVAEDKAIIKPAAQADLPVNAFSSVKAALAQQQSSLADLIEKIDNIEEETSLALIHQTARARRAPGVATGEERARAAKVQAAGSRGAEDGVPPGRSQQRV